jgi:hypothetical protein
MIIIKRGWPTTTKPSHPTNAAINPPPKNESVYIGK